MARCTTNGVVMVTRLILEFHLDFDGLDFKQVLETVEVTASEGGCSAVICGLEPILKEAKENRQGG